MQEWTEKQLHEQFSWHTQKIAIEDQWSWLKQECLKRETKALVMVHKNEQY